MRVVSLLPSATELLCAIGGESLLVGRSHECDFPESIESRPALTAQRTVLASSSQIDQQVRETLASGDSLYEIDADALRNLRPDVILTQDLCTVCSIDLKTVRAIAATIEPEPMIVSLDPKSIFDVFDDLLTIGKATGLEQDAEAAMVRLRARYWEAIDFVNPYESRPEVAFLEWTDPPFAGGHWTPGLIEAAGGQHSLNAAGEPSRQITPEELLEKMPDRVIVCPCGLDLERAQQERELLKQTKWWALLPAVQEGNVAVVDGSAMFNRPGPRLVDAFCWLVAWLQDRPEVHPDGFPVQIG